MFLISILACHLFTPLEITCVEGMECAGDTAAIDSAGDSAAGDAPRLGMVISVRTAGGTSVQVLDPTGARVDTRGGFGDAAGPVAADPATGRVIVASDTALLWNTEATAPNTVSLGAPARGIDLLPGQAVRVLDAGSIRTFDLGSSTAPEFVPMPPDEQGVSMSTAPDGAGLVTTFSGSAHLYGYDGSALTERVRGYDESALRARVVAWGPDDAPCLCTSVGAVYTIDALAHDEAPVPLVYANVGLQDVSACAWDPGNDSWLFFSPTAGFVRADASGRATVLAAPGASETYLHGNTWRTEGEG